MLASQLSQRATSAGRGVAPGVIVAAGFCLGGDLGEQNEGEAVVGGLGGGVRPRCPSPRGGGGCGGGSEECGYGLFVAALRLGLAMIHSVTNRSVPLGGVLRAMTAFRKLWPTSRAARQALLPWITARRSSRVCSLAWAWSASLAAGFGWGCGGRGWRGRGSRRCAADDLSR